jgi:glycosyltransferase involved in cell wall biosynthesis
MKISICIPTYGMKGKGAKYLNQNLASIAIQSIQPHEVIISDHSSDDIVEQEANKWKDILNIRYFRNTEKIGSISSNLNNCISKATGDIVDFMLQDDYYYTKFALEQRGKLLGESHWALTATIHYAVEKAQFYWHLIPEYRQDIYLGYNSIGSPSLLTIKREGAPLFDEDLFMLTDCDYYKQLYDKFGLPVTSPEITVVSCMWEGQSQKGVSDDAKSKEVQKVKSKYENI